VGKRRGGDKKRNGGGDDDEISKQEEILFTMKDGSVYKYEGERNDEGKPMDGEGKLIKIKSKNYFGFTGSSKEPNGTYYFGNFKDGKPDDIFKKKDKNGWTITNASNYPITKNIDKGKVVSLNVVHDNLNPRR
jgi:hypothetical protein